MESFASTMADDIELDKKQTKLFAEVMRDCHKPIADTFFKIVWVDQHVFSYENLVYFKAFKTLGYQGFRGFEKLDSFAEFLREDYVKDNVFVISSGAFAKDVIAITKNQVQQKVKKIIVFCFNIEYH